MAFKNTLLCCRESGNVYSSKAQQGVARERAVLKDETRLGVIFFKENTIFFNFGALQCAYPGSVVLRRCIKSRIVIHILYIHSS